MHCTELWVLQYNNMYVHISIARHISHLKNSKNISSLKRLIINLMIKLMAMVKRKLLDCNFEQDVAFFMTFSWKLEIVLILYSYWLGSNVFG